jgi:hypothetical protein
MNVMALPYLGGSCPGPSPVVTIVASTTQDFCVSGLDDSTPGQLYAGNKQSSGNPIERAGLHGGQLFGIRVTAAGGG